MLYNIKVIPLHRFFMVLVFKGYEILGVVTTVFISFCLRFMLMVLEG